MPSAEPTCLCLEPKNMKPLPCLIQGLIPQVDFTGEKPRNHRFELALGTDFVNHTQLKNENVRTMVLNVGTVKDGPHVGDLGYREVTADAAESSER